MTKYIIRRLLLTVLVVFGVVLIVFTILSLTPGDPGRLILGQKATQAAVDQLNHELGVDQPFFVQLWNYLKNIILHFDFGKSYTNRNPVIDEIAKCFPVTLKLALFSALFSSIVGVVLGVLSAVKQYSALDNVCSVSAMFFASAPDFWVGLMLLSIFALKLHWLPSFGIKTGLGYILPVATLTLFCSAGILRMTRSSMLDVVNQEYVRTAKAKGAGRRKIIWKHALKNALLPVLTALGMNFGSLFGGAVTTEMVFSLPGVGSLLIGAVKSKDIPLAMGSTIFLAVVFSLIMLAVDIIQAFVDPRVKARYTGGKG